MVKRARTVVLLALMAILTVGGVAYAGGDSSAHGWFGWGRHHAGGFGHHDFGDADGHIVAGEITAVGASSLTIAGHDGKAVTVEVDGGTKVYSGHDPAQLSDLKAGWVAFVFKGDDGVASVVRAADPAAMTKALHDHHEGHGWGWGHDGHVVAGKITAVGASSLTITGRDGKPTTVTTDGSTRVYAMHDAAKLSALEVGWFAFAVNGKDGVADMIRAADPTAFGHHGDDDHAPDSESSNSTT